MTPLWFSSFPVLKQKVTNLWNKIWQSQGTSALCKQYFLFVAFLFILWYLTFKSLIHILNSTQVHYPNAPERSVKLKNEKQTNKPSLFQSGWSQINFMSNPMNSLTMYIPRRRWSRHMKGQTQNKNSGKNLITAKPVAFIYDYNFKLWFSNICLRA